MLVIARAYRDAEVISSGRAIWGIFRCIVPPFGWADMVTLEWNISLYFPPSHAIIYIYLPKMHASIVYVQVIRQLNVNLHTDADAVKDLITPFYIKNKKRPPQELTVAHQQVVSNTAIALKTSALLMTCKVALMSPNKHERC